jgi:3-hydroxyacyl-[acyl-carrier-protein] dehydratase
MSEVIMDINEVMKYLPHRPPFLFVDKIVEIDIEARKIVAMKNVTMNEPFFQGHFPQQPIMPGVLILEALAQTATVGAFYLTKDDPKDTLYYFAGVDSARFKKPVVPGDQLKLSIVFQKARHGIWKAAGEVHVDDKLVCTSTFMSVRAKGPESDS